jgi:hypothetical protein
MEFTLALPFLVPLLLGTFVFGFRLVRAQQIDQITRDLAHMYSRNVDFTQTGAVSNAQSLAGQFNLTSGGSSVAIFSTIQIETAAMCKAITGSTTCNNLGQPVFVEQVAIGNITANQSAFGTPVASGSLPATSGVSNDYSTEVSLTAQATNSWAVAQGFNSILPLNPGQITYVVEMFNNTSELSITGLTGMPNVYSRAIF